MGLTEGKVVLITGGSQGIGLAIAKEFIENGSKVAILAKTQEEIDVALAELAELYPGQEVLGAAPDITSRTEMMETVGKVVEKWGRLDVMINNAGISQINVFSKFKEGEFERVQDINVNGVYTGAWCAYQYMKANKSGVIINTASVSGIHGGFPAGVGYIASKAAVIGFTEALGRELVRKNIRVCAVAPGMVDTAMTQDEQTEAYAKTLPMKRMLTPQEIANVYVFLASDLASGVTATTVSVDGAYRP